MALEWGTEQQARLDAIRDDLAQVSTASACQLLVQQGWRNTYMQGLLPLKRSASVSGSSGGRGHAAI